MLTRGASSRMRTAGFAGKCSQRQKLARQLFIRKHGRRRRKRGEKGGGRANKRGNITEPAAASGQTDVVCRALHEATAAPKSPGREDERTDGRPSSRCGWSARWAPTPAVAAGRAIAGAEQNPTVSCAPAATGWPPGWREGGPRREQHKPGSSARSTRDPTAAGTGRGSARQQQQVQGDA